MSTNRTRPDAGHERTGRRLAGCRYCGGALPPRRRSFCGGSRTQYGWKWIDGARVSEVLVAGHGCIHEWCLRSDPSYLRSEVYRRDRGVCALCGVDCTRGVTPTWQADHIVPVVEGGGECGLDNMRTLCAPCHRGVTAELHRRRAAQRREESSAGQESLFADAAETA